MRFGRLKTNWPFKPTSVWEHMIPKGILLKDHGDSEVAKGSEK
jgi:hypothetical protein